MPSSKIIGIDIGGTKIALGLVDESGKVLEKIRIETRVKEGAEGIEKDLTDAILQLKKSDNAISAIGIGMAGQIDTEKGIVVYAPNLGWHDVPLKNSLEQKTQLPVYITNDVRAAGYGEWHYGAGSGSSDFICIFVGTGLGGAIVSQGQMLQGYNNSAGEIGHMVVDMNGPKCTCGNRGCAESYASGWAIAKRAKEGANLQPWKARKLIELVKGKVEDINAKTVRLAALHGDPLSSKVIREAKEALISLSVSLVHALNPQRLIFGGGVMQGNESWIDEVNQEVRKRALKTATKKLEIMKAILSEPGVVGAAAFAKKNSFS